MKSQQIFIVLLLLVVMGVSCTKRQNIQPQVDGIAATDEEVKLPRKLFFSPVPIPYVLDNPTYWSDTLDLDGFIQGNIADWFSPMALLEEREEQVSTFNTVCADHGINYNFCKISFGYGDLPPWSDTRGIDKLLTRLTTICNWISATGFYGVAFDTEPYGKSIWDMDKDKHGPISYEVQVVLVRDFGSRLGLILNQAGLDCMLILEGSFYQHVNGREYATWWALAEGMMEMSPNPVIIGCENSYGKYSESGVRKYSEDLQMVFDKVFPEQRNYLFAYGAYPLGFYDQRQEAVSKRLLFYDSQGRLMKDSFRDKGPRYSVDQFRQQLEYFSPYSPEWIWIYGHGAAWWQLDTTVYRDIWNPASQALPVHPQLPLFARVLREAETVRQDSTGKTNLNR